MPENHRAPSDFVVTGILIFLRVIAFADRAVLGLVAPSAMGGWE